jgi:imidazolonepropionase-like amidohydrolase
MTMTKPVALLGACLVGALLLTLVSCVDLRAGGATTGEALEISQGVVIKNATVVNTRDGSLSPSLTLILEQGKIKTITRAKVRTSGNATTIDATGKYVVPGYQDMHTHAQGSEAQSANTWALMIAHGITGIREMSGAPALVKRAQQHNAGLAAGRIDAPEILQIPAGIFFGMVNTPAAAIAQVQQQKAAGGDFIKVTNANREVSFALLAEAKLQGLGVVGHLSPSASAVEVSKAGWHAIEHLGAGMGVLLDCTTEETSIRQAMLRGEGAKPPFPPTFILTPMLYRAIEAPFYQRIMNGYDEAKCLTAAKSFAEQGTWQVPTLLRLRTMLASDDQRYRVDPNLMYVDKTTRALWESLAVQYASTVPPSAAATFRNFYTAQLKLTKLLKSQGGKMLAGSDLGGIWVIAGVSLHQEFRELAEAGLSPLEILQMTTLNPAEFLKREASMGTVNEGKNADLVLLEANPLQDAAHLSKIAGVFLKGKYFSKEALEALKKGVALNFRNMPPQALNLALDPNHVH